MKILATDLLSGFLAMIGFMLTMLITLKIFDVEPVAHWSWFWVLCPFWVPITLIIMPAIIVGVIEM